MRLTSSISLLGLLLILMPLLPALANDAQMEVEPNDTMTTATVVVRTPLIGLVGAEGDDVDWFVVTDVPEFMTFDFWVTHNPDECNIDFEVFSDGTSIGIANGTDSPDAVTCPVEGSCYVRVFSTHGQGAYDLAFTTHYDVPEGYIFHPGVASFGCF